MARTLRQRPQSSLKRQRVQNRRKAENAALDALLEEQVRIRHINRLSSFMTQIPNPWDDKLIAACREWPHKHYSRARNQAIFDAWFRQVV